MLFEAVKARSEIHQATRTARALEGLKQKIAADRDRLAKLPISQAARQLGFVKSYAQIRALLEGISK